MTLTNIFLIIAFISNLILALLIFFNSNKKINKIASAFVLLVAFWIISIYILKLFPSNLFAQLPFAIASFIPTFLLIFILNFNKDRNLKDDILIIIPSLLLASIAFVNGAFFKDFKIEQNSIITTGFGYAYFLFIVYFISYSLLAIIILIKSFFQSKGVLKVQLRFLLYGFIVSLSLITLSSLVLPLFGIYILNSVSPIFSLFMTGFFAYAITKHHLLEMKVILSEIWASALMIVVLIWCLVNFSFLNLIILIMILSISILFINSTLSESAKNKQLEKLNRHLERDKEKLVKLDRMKDEFLMMATHELTTPISIIRGKLAMGIDENMAHFDEEQKKFLMPVYDSTNRLNHLSQELLNVTMIDQHELDISLEPTNIHELVKEIVDKYQEEAKEKEDQLTFVSNYKDQQVNIDQKKIKEVVSNLIDNAISFTKNGKIVVDLKINETDKNVLLSVSDNGTGIDEKSKKLLFGKFSQSERFDPNNPSEQQGVGLGLYISKNFIELHGGKMWFESEKDKGATFYFTLPIV